jgi:outer membrane protein assembly factor BamB
MLSFTGDTPSITSLLMLANGDILIGGILLNNIASTGAIIVLRMDQNGGLIWSKTVNHPSSVDNLSELPDGNILITGVLREFYNTPPNKTTLIKADANGTALWTRQYGAGFSFSRPLLVGSNEWYFTSFTEAPHVFNTDSLGNSVCESEPFSLVFQNLPVSVSTSTCVLHPITLSASTFTSNMAENQPYQDSCVYVATGIAENTTSKSLTVFPNPANQWVTLEFDNSEYSTFQLTLTDALGRTVYQEIVKGPTIQLMTDVFPNGLYYLRLTSTQNSEHIAGKFVVKKK